MNEPHASRQQERENPDPYEGRNPVPWPMLALVVLLMAFGMVYIATSDIETPGSWGDGRQRSELQGQAKAAAGAADGAATFASLCAACHQASGLGLPGVFPPLAGSEWVKGSDSTLAAIVLHGVSGPLTVDGKTYNGAMPAFKAQLDDAQIAAVLSHVRSQWGNSSPAVGAEAVAKVREATRDRTAPFAGEQELPKP